MSRRMIVVTGGAGFIGSNIVARLCAEDRRDVVVCDRLEDAALGKWKNIAKHPIDDFWQLYRCHRSRNLWCSLRRAPSGRWTNDIATSPRTMAL